MNNIKTGKDSNTNNESSDDEKNTGDNKQSFELGTMFTATRKANNKMVKKVATQDHRIINTKKTSTREKKNYKIKQLIINQRKKMKILLKNMHMLTGRYGKLHKFPVSQILNSNICFIQFYLDND